jgi:hypothetical protein
VHDVNTEGTEPRWRQGGTGGLERGRFSRLAPSRPSMFKTCVVPLGEPSFVGRWSRRAASSLART